MKGPTLVFTEQSFATFWVAIGRWQILGGLCSSVCSLPPCGVTERTFLGASGVWETLLTSCSLRFLGPHTTNVAADRTHHITLQIP